MTGRPASEVGVRCVEYHTVQPGGGLPDPKHHDIGSLLTVDILLSPRAEFGGGTFSTLEADGELLPHRFGGRGEGQERPGDALLFLSHKWEPTHTSLPLHAAQGPELSQVDASAGTTACSR